MTTQTFVHGDVSVVRESIGGVAADRLVGPGADELLVRSDPGAVRTALADGLGSTIATRNAAGELDTRFMYEPYGATASSGTGVTDSAQFTGRDSDAPDLYYFRARYYSPSLHRFLSEDPIRAPGTNSYEYVSSDPVNSVDPNGLYDVTIHRGFRVNYDVPDDQMPCPAPSCLREKLDPGCDCRCGPDGRCRLSLKPSYRVTGLYIHEWSSPVDWVYRREVRLRHELDHYKAAVRILNGAARQDGMAREARTYRTFAECQRSCENWAKNVKEMLRYAVNEVLKFFDLQRILGL